MRTFEGQELELLQEAEVRIRRVLWVIVDLEGKDQILAKFDDCSEYAVSCVKIHLKNNGMIILKFSVGSIKLVCYVVDILYHILYIPARGKVFGLSDYQTISTAGCNYHDHDLAVTN